jgi:hypothetical protein
MFGEPNRYNFITGERWAPVYRYLETQIRESDPSAKIVGTSMLNWDFTCIGCGGYTLGRSFFLDFVEEYNDLYGDYPEVDVWAIDVYPIDWLHTPNGGAQADEAIDQMTSMRATLDNTGGQYGFDYEGVPIWVTEIAVHWGFDGWTINGSSLSPVGEYHWENMSDYLIEVLDWLEDNADDYGIEKWFFYRSWADVYDPVDYAGIYFFEDSDPVTELTCLGRIYRSRAIGGPRLACDEDGDTVAD